MGSRAFVCGPNPAVWGEPWLVHVVEDETCDINDCGLEAGWLGETVGYLGMDEPPYMHPTWYSCDDHLALQMKASITPSTPVDGGV